MEKTEFKMILRELQVELIKYQRSMIKKNEEIRTVYEEKKTTDKDDTIK